MDSNTQSIHPSLITDELITELLYAEYTLELMDTSTLTQGKLISMANVNDMFISYNINIIKYLILRNHEDNIPVYIKILWNLTNPRDYYFTDFKHIFETSNINKLELYTDIHTYTLCTKLTQSNIDPYTNIIQIIAYVKIDPNLT